ncbi:MAG TPA: DUF2834 domain-containing protein [Leptolyngbyaceae cyanobacterium M65_K2018_010]|nr:DUF2834 domain-containing protein [Leptolyngbyaceae cyanobacterium M65_K2018_010]
MAKLLFGTLWLGLIVYAVRWAPPEQPETWDLIRRLSTGNWAGINPAVIALFNAMGLWPMVYAGVVLGVVLIDGRGQKLWAWPFVLASFAAGAFALLPYLALRSPNPTFLGPKGPGLRLVDAGWLGGILATGAIALLTWGGLQGDWFDFWQQWQTSRFIHVMTLDFCTLWLLFPALLGDDMARRGLAQPWVWAGVIALPLVGASLYLALRPPLAEGTENSGPALL